MKKIMVFLILVIVNFGCSSPTDPIDKMDPETTLNKSISMADIHADPYPQLQVFDNIPIEWEIDGTDLYINIVNKPIIRLASNYFLIIRSESPVLGEMLYVGKRLYVSDFTMKSIGFDYLTDVKLYAIIEYVN